MRAADTEEQLSMKFGCDPVKEAPNLLLTAKSLGMEVVGVTLRFDREMVKAKSFQKAVKAAREIFDVAAGLGYDFDVLDFGDCFSVAEEQVFDMVRLFFKLQIFCTCFWVNF